MRLDAWVGFGLKYSDWDEASEYHVMIWKRFPHYWSFVSTFTDDRWIPLMPNFEVLFVVNMKKLLNKQSSCGDSIGYYAHMTSL